MRHCPARALAIDGATATWQLGPLVRRYRNTGGATAGYP